MNPLGANGCVLGVRKLKFNKENSLVFIRPFGPLFSLIAPKLWFDMFVLQVDGPFLFDFGDSNWRQA